MSLARDDLRSIYKVFHNWPNGETYEKKPTIFLALRIKEVRTNKESNKKF